MPRTRQPGTKHHHMNTKRARSGAPAGTSDPNVKMVPNET
jgi:hypothetical protein